MKKTININLGGHPIIIDEDAFQQLETYLSSIDEYFASSEGREEIVTDIETRIAELFHQELKGKKIVSAKEVQKVIEIMGVPEHFDGNEAHSESEDVKDTPGESQRQQKQYKRSGTKRLFRDPSNKVIGGVASGLSAYFGIEDPVWLRIAFVLLFFTTGVGLLIYLIMWIIVPKAKTASDRLSMHGDPINVDSIAHNIEEDLSDLSRHVKKFGQDMKKKYGSSKNKNRE